MRRILLTLLLLSTGVLAEKPGLTLNTKVKDFVAKYCYECHDEDLQKGDVRLDNLSERVDNSSTALVWQDILDILNTGEMPPKKADQPKVEELSEVIGSLTKDLLKARKILTDQGGEIVIRRLNKREYINSIKTVTGIELPDRLVPDDEVSEGFNTMGANQYFSPSLIDRYLELGELALSKIILDGDKKKDRKRNASRGKGLPEVIRKQLRKSIDKRTKDYENSLLVMNEGHDYKKYGFSDKQQAKHNVQNYNGITTLQKHYLEHESTKTGFLLMQRAHHKESISMKADFRGKYILRIKVATEDGMPDERKYLEITQNDKLLGYYYIHGTLAKPQLLELEVSPEIDVRSLSLVIKEKENNRLPNTYYQTRLTKRINKGEFLPSIWVGELALEGPFYSGFFAKKKQEILNGVNIENATDGELASIFKKFAEKAFRGSSVSDDYVAHLINIYHQELNFKKSKLAALIKPLATVLTSPDFLFLGEEKEEGKRKSLSGKELVSRLSYTLWKDMPNEQLLQSKDKLVNDQKFLKSQISEMMKDHRFKAFVEEFFGQWLHLSKFDSVAFSTRIYPKFDQGLILSSKHEVFEYINYVIREDLSLENLIDSKFAVVNPMMAQYYGLPVHKGEGFKKLDLPANMAYRGGLLGKVAIQAMGTTGERNSPVERGAYILRKFLNDPPPPPPPNVPQLDSKNRKLTVSESLEKHNEIAQCRSCHRKMDPLGLAMENFDTIGRWQELKGKRERQLAGAFPDGKEFSDFKTMKSELLMRKEKMVESIVEALIKYGLGREQEFSDLDFVDGLMKVAKENDYRFKPLLVAFLTSKQFTQK